MSEKGDFPTVQFLRGDDWVGLYVDGELKYDGHSIQEEDVVRYVLGSYLPTLWMENEEFWEYVGGRCPDSWGEVEEIIRDLEIEEDQHRV